jgi:5'-nucleotidase
LPSVAALSARVALELARLGAHSPSGSLVSLNVPERWNGEVRATRLGKRIYEEIVDFRRDPRGREYLWLGGPGVRHERDAGTDTDAYDDGAASITPLVLDLTSAADVEAMASLAAHASIKSP